MLFDDREAFFGFEMQAGRPLQFVQKWTVFQDSLQCTLNSIRLRRDVFNQTVNVADLKQYSK